MSKELYEEYLGEKFINRLDQYVDKARLIGKTTISIMEKSIDVKAENNHE